MTDTGFAAAARHLFSTIAVPGSVEYEVGERLMDEMTTAEIKAVNRGMRHAAEAMRRLPRQPDPKGARKVLDETIPLVLAWRKLEMAREAEVKS